nr:hypothetical protein [Tanacetum cinerariifolium]
MPPRSAPLTQAVVRGMIKESVDTVSDVERARHANAGNNAGGFGKTREGKKVKFVAATLQGPALTWWNSNVAILRRDVANQMWWTEMKKLMTTEFCPMEKIQRMESELWNMRVKEYDWLILKAYQLEEAVRMSHKLMEQKRQAKNERVFEGNKRKWENFQSGNSSGAISVERPGTSRGITRRRVLPLVLTLSLFIRVLIMVSEVIRGTDVLRRSNGKKLRELVAKHMRLRMLSRKVQMWSFVNNRFSSILDIDPIEIDTSYEVELADGRVASTNTVLKGWPFLVKHVYHNTTGHFGCIIRETTTKKGEDREDEDSVKEVKRRCAKQARFRELFLCCEGNQEDRAIVKERDLGNIRYIKDEEGRTIVIEEDIRKRGGEYFSSLFNERRPEGSVEVKNSIQPLQFDCYYSRINQGEVRAALQKIGRNKAVGPDQIPIEAWRERQRDLHMAFLDLKKAYDSVPRELIWRTLIDKRTPRRYLRVIKDTYDEAKTSIRSSAEDIVLVAELADGLNIRLESWRKALEDNGLQVSREKTEYLRCNFGRVVIRPAMLYEAKCWPITKAQANKVEVEELRMLRWTCGKTMLDMIPNGVFRAKLEVESIIYKMREGRLRWFRYVKRRPQTAPVRRVETILVDGLRRRGRSNLRWEDRLKHDMNKLLLSENMTSDRNA